MIAYIASRYGENNNKICQQWETIDAAMVDAEGVTLYYEGGSSESIEYSSFICVDIYYTETKCKRVQGGQYD